MRPEDSTFEVPKCCLTKQINFVPFEWGSYHLNIAPPFGVAKCQDTGMLYLCPRPKKELREALYSNEIPEALKVYTHKTYNYAAVDKLRTDDFEDRLKFFDDYFKNVERKKLLDIGTSGGTFLEKANAHKWDAYGIEPFEEDVKLCKSKGLNVINGVAESLPFDDNTFEVVHASHVFEHLDDPLIAAIEAYRVLKPGGIIFIEVPNQLDNFGFRRDMLFKRVPQRKRDITSIHHLWFFGRKTLKILLEKAEFQRVKVQNVYSKPFSGWRYPFSIFSRMLSSMFYGTYIIRAYGFKDEKV